MEYKRIVAAGLTCAMLFSLPVTTLAVRKGSGGPKAAGKLDTTQIVPVTSGSLSFDQIERRIRAHNLNVRAAKEGLEQVKAMNWNKAIGELDDAIEEMEDLIDTMSASSTVDMQSAVTNIAAALTAIQNAAEAEQAMVTAQAAAAIAGSTAQISAQTTIATYSKAQAESLKSTLESLEDQRDELKKQKDNYPKTIEDTERMVESTVDQLVSGAESLYLTILSTQLQYDSLQDTVFSMQKTVEEMQLRYDLGQISAQTLLQVQNGYATLVNSSAGLENTLVTMRSSLQSLLGEVPDGKLSLTDTPDVTQEQLDAIRYAADLEKAKEKSYTLYSARRSVEKAEDEMDTARKDHGKNSYQYQMAEHAYQSAVYQQSATIASFELSFQNLHLAIAPAQATLGVKEADLAYQEQVCAAAELKYQQGNISANALQEAVNARESARRDVEAARLDLFTAYHAYRQAVDKGLVN